MAARSLEVDRNPFAPGALVEQRRLSSAPARAEMRGALEALRCDGYVILPGLLSS